jgi:hypothetical protein
MRKMINIIMKGLWDGKLMSKHSLTGKNNCRTNNPAKPAFSKEGVQAP